MPGRALRGLPAGIPGMDTGKGLGSVLPLDTAIPVFQHAAGQGWGHAGSRGRWHQHELITVLITGCGFKGGGTGRTPGGPGWTPGAGLDTGGAGLITGRGSVNYRVAGLITGGPGCPCRHRPVPAAGAAVYRSDKLRRSAIKVSVPPLSRSVPLSVRTAWPELCGLRGRAGMAPPGGFGTPLCHPGPVPSRVSRRISARSHPGTAG